MPKLTTNIENTNTSVSEMRRQLAQVLSRVPGDQPVNFSFKMAIEDYRGRKEKSDAKP